MCFRLNILIAKFVTLVDKNITVLCSLYFEIKQQQMVNMCIRVEYMCV